MIAVAPLVITLILSTLTVSAPAGAIDPEAKEHLERGLAGYTAKDYAGAIKDLRLAYALDPRPLISRVKILIRRKHPMSSTTVGAVLQRKAVILPILSRWSR